MLKFKTITMLIMFSFFAMLLAACSNGGGSANTSQGGTTYAYITTVSFDESQNSINQTQIYQLLENNGALIPTNESPTLNDINASSVVINPNGSYAYVVNDDGGYNGTVSMYQINPNSGALSPLIPFQVDTQFKPYVLTIDSTGTYGYVMNDNSAISMYSINNGILSGLTPESYISESFDASTIKITPNSKYAYTNNFGNDTISMYQIGQNGNLQPLAQPTIATQSAPFDLAIHPSGQYLYAVNFWSQSINMYNISGSGILLPFTPESFVATAAENPGSITLTPDGAYAYVLSFESDMVSMYNINNSGVLIPLQSESVISTGIATSDFSSLVIDTSGKYAYINGLDLNDNSSKINMYSIADNGRLVPLAPKSSITISNTLIVGISFYRP